MKKVASCVRPIVAEGRRARFVDCEGLMISSLTVFLGRNVCTFKLSVVREGGRNN